MLAAEEQGCLTPGDALRSLTVNHPESVAFLLLLHPFPPQESQVSFAQPWERRWRERERQHGDQRDEPSHGSLLAGRRGSYRARVAGARERSPLTPPWTYASGVS